jgi:hypothetical protein
VVTEAARPPLTSVDMNLQVLGGEAGASLLEMMGANRSRAYADCPVREQTRVVGHAVRAMYMASAMADLALELGDEELKCACEALWRDVTTAEMYVTGGLGPKETNEGFCLAIYPTRPPTPRLALRSRSSSGRTARSISISTGATPT